MRLTASNRAQQLALRHRWPAIVAAMRALVDGYNAGTGSPSLQLVDRSTSDEEALALDVIAGDGRVLTLAVDDGDLWVRRAQDAGGSVQGERWIGTGRSDTATAAYALQDWMSRLQATDDRAAVR